MVEKSYVLFTKEIKMDLRKQLVNTVIIWGIVGVLVAIPIYPKSLVNSPKTLQKWLEKEFTYKADDEDYWKYPKETVKDKGGDCEDFAFLTKYILNALGYEAKAIWVYGRKYTVKEDKIQDIPYSHVICIFKEKDKYRYFSNIYLYQKTFETWEQVVKYECPRWSWFRQIELPNIKYRKIENRSRKCLE